MTRMYTSTTTSKAWPSIYSMHLPLQSRLKAFGGSVGVAYIDFFSRRYEQHLKCKGSFKDLPWKYKIFQAQRHSLNSFLFNFSRLFFADLIKKKILHSQCICTLIQNFVQWIYYRVCIRWYLKTFVDARPGKSNSSPCTGWDINEYQIGHQMSRDMRFPTMWYVRPAKSQTSLRIRADWSRPLLLAWIFYNC